MNRDVLTPVVGPDSMPFWAYATSGELRVQRCTSCARLRWPPSPLCAECWSESSEWQRLSGRGRIQSWVVYHRQYLEHFPPPHLVVLVEMDEGPRLEANLLDFDIDTVERGMLVEMTFEKQGGRIFPQFRVASPRPESS